MPNTDGTRDALAALKERATRAGKPFNRSRVCRRGRPDDGGQTGQLVLVDNDGNPVRDANGDELAVRWCTTGELVDAFKFRCLDR